MTVSPPPSQSQTEMGRRRNSSGTEMSMNCPGAVMAPVSPERRILYAPSAIFSFETIV